MRNPMTVELPVPPNLTDSQKFANEVARAVMNLGTSANSMAEELKEIKHVSDKLHEIVVVGNGEKSLRERIRNLEKFVDKFEYWAKLVGGALLLNFLGFAVATIVALVRFLPVLEKLANP